MKSDSLRPSKCLETVEFVGFLAVLSDNLSENSIRPVTVGRCNWLFCDSTDGADASMMVYSLLKTAEANGLNPQKYLKYILQARPDKDLSDEVLETIGSWSPVV